MFQLTNIQIIILKKKIKNLFEKAYDKSTKFIKYFIKNFKIKTHLCNNLN